MMEIREENGGLVCAFSGKLDTLACHGIEKELLTRVCEAKGKVTFDLEEVTFVASMFLRLCIQSCKELGGDRFRIVNVDPAVDKIFKLAGLDTMMTIE